MFLEACLKTIKSTQEDEEHPNMERSMKALVIIGGGIAAYKSLDVIRNLRALGCEVESIMTDAAQKFITPLSVSSLTGHPVHTDLFAPDTEATIGHIHLARMPSALLVVPATADFLAKMALGHANDLASTVMLATDRPIIVAPAMNPTMWKHLAVQENVRLLKERGVIFVDPQEGPCACGEEGLGKLADVESICDAFCAVTGFLVPRSLDGLRILVTSGPTHEPIDPVRYLGNHSSGRQGHALAQAAAEAGAEVTLISGPVALSDPSGVRVLHVTTAQEMFHAVEAALPADIAIFAAAVSDWRVEQTSQRKLKKSEAKGSTITLACLENPDILASVAQRKVGRPSLVIGFAAETHDLLSEARHKVARKGCDWIVANDVQGAMGGLQNKIHLLKRDGSEEAWPSLDKLTVARHLMREIAREFSGIRALNYR